MIFVGTRQLSLKVAIVTLEDMICVGVWYHILHPDRTKPKSKSKAKPKLKAKQKPKSTCSKLAILFEEIDDDHHDYIDDLPKF